MPEGKSEYPDDIIAAAQWALMGNGIAVNFGADLKGRLLNDIMAVLLNERKYSFEEGFKSGFGRSGEGWNGEHPGIDYDTDAHWIYNRELSLAQFLGQPLPAPPSSTEER